MQKENFELFMNQDQFQNGSEELKEDCNNRNQSLFEYRYPYIDHTSFDDQSQKQEIKFEENQNQDLIDLISMQKKINNQMLKRPHNSTLLDQDFFVNSSSSDVKTKQNEEVKQENTNDSIKQKTSKQNLYSKNYREKKKQQFKALEEQNQFLKKKVQDLQMRLRQIQIQNDRLKKFPNEKDLTIHELNRYFMQKISLLAKSIENNINQEKDQNLRKKSRAELQKQFIQRYDELGFSGTKRKLVLEYHMNEIFEAVLRDSEKYLCLLCCKNEDDSLKIQMPQYQRINTAFFQIMELDEKDMQRLNVYKEFLFPAMKQLKKQFSDFYKKFRQIIQSLNRIHYLQKQSNIHNLDFVIKRMKIENWFQYHKYHKIMRKLKSKWLQFIKSEDSINQLDSNQYDKGYKKMKSLDTIISE